MSYMNNAAIEEDPWGTNGLPLDALREVEPQEHQVFTHNQALRTMWHAAIARNVSPWGVLGAVLAYTAAATEPTVTTPPIIGGNGSLNLLVGMVADSGVGKGASQAVAKEFLKFQRAGWEIAIPIHPLGTGEGIAQTFMPAKQSEDDAPQEVVTRTVFVASEVDGLAASASRRGSTLMSILRKVWSGENPGNTNGSRDTTRNVPDHSYRAVLIADIQPLRSAALLNDDETAGGTPQRWLWMPLGHYPLSQRSYDEEIAQPYTVTLPKESEFSMELPQQVWESTKQAHIRRVEGTNVPTLNGHRNMTQIKVACLLALLDGRKIVSEEDWDTARIVMDKSDDGRNRCLQALKEKQAEDITKRARMKEESAEAGDQARMEKTRQWIVSQLRNLGTLRMSGEGGLNQRARRYRAELPGALQSLIDDGHVIQEQYNGDDLYRLAE